MSRTRTVWRPRAPSKALLGAALDLERHAALPQPRHQGVAHRRGRGEHPAGHREARVVEREAARRLAHQHGGGPVARVALGSGLGDVPRATRRARMDLDSEEALAARLLAWAL